MWLIEAVVCVVAAALRSRTIGSCQSTATSYDCTAWLVAASLRKYRYRRIRLLPFGNGQNLIPLTITETEKIEKTRMKVWSPPTTSGLETLLINLDTYPLTYSPGTHTGPPLSRTLPSSS